MAAGRELCALFSVYVTVRAIIPADYKKKQKETKIVVCYENKKHNKQNIVNIKILNILFI